MRRGLEIGGALAAIVLVGFGVAAIVMGIDSSGTANDSVEEERIVGAPNMTPDAVSAEAEKARLPEDVDLPSCDVAGEEIDSTERGRCYAEYLRIQTMVATGGFTIAQVGRYQAKPGAPQGALADGGGTEDPRLAVIDPKTSLPVMNPAYEAWVETTALATALNNAYVSDQLSTGAVVVGIALLLTGIGFAVLVAAGAVRDPNTTFGFLRRGRTSAA